MASISATPSEPIPNLAHNVANHQIDFTRPLQNEVVIISTPQDDDSLDVLARKMSAISEVVNANRSIAVATNYKGMAYHSFDPVSIALQGLTSCEKDMYEAWKADKYALPPIKWQSMVEPATTGKNSHRRSKARLEALRIIYSYPQATEENLAYITKNFEDTLLPLVRVVARIKGVKKHLTGNQDSLSMEEWAEMQCEKEINTAARRILQKVWIDINVQHTSVRAALNVLQVRHQAMNEKLQGQRTEQKRQDDMLARLEKSLDETLEE